MRAYAREVAFCMLYGNFINEETPVEISDEFFDMNKLEKKDIEFALSLYNGSIERKQEFIDIISNIAIGFKIERINKIELALLCIAMLEINSDITPCAVAIDEAVKLARKYSGEKSTGFINGILAKYLKSIPNEPNEEVLNESL